MRLAPCLRAVAFVSATLACLPASAQIVQGENGLEGECTLYDMRRPRPLTAAAARTWVKLATPVAMPFEDEVPLEDIFKYIRQQTADPHNAGLAIFVDPVALGKKHVTMESPVTIGIEGVPLSTSLGLMLKGLGLSYGVQEDGVLVVGIQGEIPSSQSRHVTKAQAEAWIRLDRRVDVPFGKPASLGEVVDFLRTSTREKDGDDGLSIYVDPVSLQEHDLTQDVKMSLDLKGVPLSTALSMMLKQVDLTFIIQKDGILVIDHKDSSLDEDGDREDTPDLRALVQGNMIDLDRLRREVRSLKAGEPSPKSGPKGRAAIPKAPGGANGAGGEVR